ncbi:hypothetical protein [Natrinema versiforme]|uniref:Uncharacterized protein n=1 Tax=Natrinema versiforme JCM 10478 TaxID=1227496 RepID=L9Y4D5_9EURY|nr:hypothetical protein [Natrinema versiforme]ELY68930.1 hypothetical protein C489_06173 [Natrinema versiforme JCM 10478]
MSTDDRSENTLPPPSPLRRYTFGDIEILARYAVHVDGDPRKVYCFDAREIEFAGTDEWVRPPASFDDGHDMAGLNAFWYPAESGDVIFYYLEQMEASALGDSYSPTAWTDGDVPFDRLPPFGACMALLELHELCHWAIGDDGDQPGMDDIDHWQSWNRVLADAIDYVSEDDCEWLRPEDTDLWYAEEQNGVVRTPVGVYRGREYDDGHETEQATLKSYD